MVNVKHYSYNKNVLLSKLSKVSSIFSHHDHYANMYVY